MSMIDSAAHSENAKTTSVNSMNEMISEDEIQARSSPIAYRMLSSPRSCVMSRPSEALASPRLSPSLLSTSTQRGRRVLI